MHQITKRLSFLVSLENISVPEGKKQTYTRTNLQGITNGHLLEVLLDAEHYDTILSMPGVLGCQYYCHNCDVGYRNFQNHHTACPYRCSFCPVDTPCVPTGLSFTAPNVSMACYQRHLKPYSNKTDFSMCDLMDRCQQCNNWMTKKLMERHQCRGRNSARFANNR